MIYKKRTINNIANIDVFKKLTTDNYSIRASLVYLIPMVLKSI